MTNFEGVGDLLAYLASSTMAPTALSFGNFGRVENPYTVYARAATRRRNGTNLWHLSWSRGLIIVWRYQKAIDAPRSSHCRSLVIVGSFPSFYT